MSAKLPAASRWVAVPMVVLCGAALLDDLGKFRWFWPYDKEIYSSALLVGLLWYIIFGQKMRAWVEEVRAEHDREDYPDEFTDS